MIQIILIFINWLYDAHKDTHITFTLKSYLDGV